MQKEKKISIKASMQETLSCKLRNLLFEKYAVRETGKFSERAGNIPRSVQGTIWHTMSGKNLLSYLVVLAHDINKRR